MSRVVRRSDGTVAFDPTGKAPGRGTYVCDDPACREPVRLAESLRRALGAPIAPEAISFEMTDAAS